MKYKALFITLAAIAFQPKANAVVVEYIYDAHVAGNQGTSTVIALNDSVTASIMYNTNKVNYTEILSNVAYYYFNRNIPFDQIDQDAFRISASVNASDGNTYSGSSHVGFVQVENDVAIGPNGTSDILNPSSINDRLSPLYNPYYTNNDLPYKNRVDGDAILGFEWEQITMNLRDYDASVIDDTTLPTSIEYLNDLTKAPFGFRWMQVGPLQVSMQILIVCRQS